MSRVGDSTLGIEVSRDYDDKEKREERREKREERREKREERSNNCNRVCTFPGRAAATEARREKREEITKKAARDPQID